VIAPIDDAAQPLLYPSMAAGPKLGVEEATSVNFCQRMARPAALATY